MEHNPSSMDDNDHKDHFKRVLNELIMAANRSAPAKGPTSSNSIWMDAKGSDPSASPSTSQRQGDQETGLHPALTEHVDLSRRPSLEGPRAHVTGSQHAHRKGSNVSLYTITDAGAPCEADKETMTTDPTTEKLGLCRGQRDYPIAYYHGVALDPSFTVYTRDVSSITQTMKSPDTQGDSGNTLLPHPDSFQGGSEDRNDGEVKATGIPCRTASRSLTLRTTSTNQNLTTEDRPILPPRPSALMSPRSQQPFQAQVSFDNAEILPSQSNGSQYSQARGEHISLLNADVQTIATQQSTRHDDTTQLDFLGPRHQHSFPLIDLNLQNRLWQAVQQNRVNDARFLLGRGAIPDLICGVPMSRNLPQTPLCRAAPDNHFELMALLIHHRADPNIVVPGSLPAFRYACWAYVQNPHSSLEGITMLVHHGARVDAIEMAVFLRMVDEVYAPEVTLPTHMVLQTVLSTCTIAHVVSEHETGSHYPNMDLCSRKFPPRQHYTTCLN